MNYWLLIIIPLISAFIGWITNWVAIKMLFHPREPKKILGITFHGIFPKRQQQFAEKLGKLVSAEFLSFNDIEEKIIGLTSDGNFLLPAGRSLAGRAADRVRAPDWLSAALQLV